MTNKLRRCRDCGSVRKRVAGKCNLLIGHSTEKCEGTMQVIKDER